MPMFPLGSVLFPHMPLPLRVFEERYLIMLSQLVKVEDGRFGVVLIERGFEVGGGEQRYGVGTAAEVTQLGAAEGMVGLVAQGRERIQVAEWLPDDPYPRAEVETLPELVWDGTLETLRTETEQLVRRSIAQASEFAELIWPADVELSEDPVAALWQLAAIAPLTAYDQVALLRASTAEGLLTTLAQLTRDAAVAWQIAWPDDEPSV
ncbi:LON peptidase substrate-binding domain-containing protein [uncultured Friedmanniella sp.]|uniref:LON peptidase substrate-binding domain-containing protein n=1 Tax=uncultured Friedmanniella sp. TaxID=335381 RepID=UPI0035C96E87